MLNVNKPLNEKPLYERIIMRDNNVQVKVSSLIQHNIYRISYVYREVNCFFGVKINSRLNEKRFYGLDTKDLKFCLS